MDRKDILQKAEECVCGQRQVDYGTPEDNFQCIADFWNTYINRKCDGLIVGEYPLLDAQDVAVMMNLMECARAAGAGSIDCFVDMAGYAACGGEIFSKRNPENPKIAEDFKVNNCFEYPGFCGICKKLDRERRKCTAKTICKKFDGKDEPSGFVNKFMNQPE